MTRDEINERQATIAKRLTEIQTFSRELSGSTRSPIKDDLNLEDHAAQVEKNNEEAEKLRKELGLLASLTPDD